MDDSDDEYVDESPAPNSKDADGSHKRTRAKGGDSGRGGGGSIENLKGANGGYAWEDEYHRSWDVVKEDEEGSLAGVVAGMVEASKKRRILKSSTPFQRGIIRNFVLVLDMSFAMLEKDLLPNRYQLMLNYAIEFVTEFYDQNPISQLAIVGMREGLAVLISDLSGSPHEHLATLQGIRKQEPKGDPSLQNALEMARGLLYHVPSHCTREVLLIFGALFSSDPGDIHETVRHLVKNKVRVSIIGLAAQVAICQEICSKTNFGDNSSYGVILNDVHFKELLNESTTPLAVNKLSTHKSSTLVQMGFPSRISETTSTLCSCHSQITRGGYICPQCNAKVCALPTQCPCCNLTLVLSTHLARSYHHLFPLKPFEEVPPSYAYLSSSCYSCLVPFPEISSAHVAQNSDIHTHRFLCPDCNNHFCIDCDLYCHETLHNCSGCESVSIKPKPVKKPQQRLKLT